MGPLDYYDKAGEVKWNAGEGHVSGFNKVAEAAKDVSMYSKTSNSKEFETKEEGK